YFIRFSFSKALEFRVEFYLRIIMDIVYYAVNIAFFKTLFLHTPTLGGWNEKEVTIFVACYILVDALNMTFFANNAWQIPGLINKGDLDYYLLRPVSPLFFLSF